MFGYIFEIYFHFILGDGILGQELKNKLYLFILKRKLKEHKFYYSCSGQIMSKYKYESTCCLSKFYEIYSKYNM